MDRELHILNESIVLDKLNGNENKYQEVRDNLGAFATRDGVLPEKSIICTDKKKLSCPEKVALLTVAKNNNSEDFELFMKAKLLMCKCIENMQAKYGADASKLLADQENAVLSNSRISEAITKA